MWNECIEKYNSLLYYTIINHIYNMNIIKEIIRYLELYLGKSIIIFPLPSLLIKYGVAPNDPVEWKPMCITPGIFSGSI